MIGLSMAFEVVLPNGIYGEMRVYQEGEVIVVRMFDPNAEEPVITHTIKPQDLANLLAEPE